MEGLFLLLLQVGFMNDGKILAADFQFYANAGSTVDESLWVGSFPLFRRSSRFLSVPLGSSPFLSVCLSPPSSAELAAFPLPGCREDSASSRQRLQHPQPAGPFCCLQDQPALQHGLQGLRRAPGPAGGGEHDQ